MFKRYLIELGCLKSFVFKKEGGCNPAHLLSIHAARACCLRVNFSQISDDLGRFRPPKERVPVDHCHENGTTDNVSDRDGKQIDVKECSPVAPIIPVGGEDVRGQEEHVGDTVLKADRNESTDGEPYPEYLAYRIVGRNGEPHGETYKPITADATVERLPEIERHLSVPHRHHIQISGTLWPANFVDDDT